MKPITREEQFLKALAEGKEVQTEPVTREEVLLAALAKREAAGWDGLNHRPFGEEVTVIELFPENTVATTTSGYVYRADISLKADIVDGETYTVTINEVKYQSVAENGNLGAWVDYAQGGFEDIPWCYMSGIVYWDKTLGEQITLEIAQESSTIKTIDPKYLPEISSFVTIDLADYGIDLAPYMQSYGYQTGEVEGVGIFDALTDAYKSGKSVRLRQNVFGWLVTDCNTMMTAEGDKVTLAMGTVLAWMNTSFDIIYVAFSKNDSTTTITAQHNYVPVVEPEL